MKAKKMVAPVIITVLLVIWLLLYAAACVFVPFPIVYKLAGIAVILSLIGVAVYVLLERIEEIRSGVEDDLSQY